ncbi:MAG: DUF1467 family protein [Rhodospirillales bacterium]|nr:DUF1467 family protein [Rhodospirillales bacterium]
MGIWTWPAVFIIIWWLVIFMVLPWSAKRIEPDKLGEEEGADPDTVKKPNLLMRILLTTVISGVIFGLVYLIVVSGVISFGKAG